jgi:hypothetical protein
MSQKSSLLQSAEFVLQVLMADTGMTRLLLTHIRRRFVIEACPLNAKTEVALKADPRPGAKAILVRCAATL